MQFFVLNPKYFQDICVSENENFIKEATTIS